MSRTSDESAEFRKGVIEDVLVWVGLLVLLGLTLGASMGEWGPLSTALSFAISMMKTLLVVFFYMHLKHEKGMTRIFALAGAAWLVVFFSIVLSDYVTRSWLPYPSRWPIFVKLRTPLNEEYGPDEQKAPRPGDFGPGR